ncbi:hypothetical protein QR680_002378 [Steinernema hermaphroditum]|uniref:inorganic diphosphatase n=1 Tax=Steinernema hermaphroditum TaxID=289476 RepID=A0AA39H2G7_9BILA|nr:hypothetical protein QR680_002378 [Steinernema hermaphroditum]
MDSSNRKRKLSESEPDRLLPLDDNVPESKEEQNQDDRNGVEPDGENAPAQPSKPFISHIVEVGTLNTENYRCYLKDENGELLSLWHDIPLYPEGDASNNVYNIVVETPRFSNPRLELCHTEPMNPIVHTYNSDGTLSYAENVFPFTGYPFNYGYFPQTYTDPNQRSDNQPAPGDGDLVDAIDISQHTRKTGEVVKVKVLGALAFIVENRLDWKIVCVDVNDPLTQKIKEVYQLEFVMPGIIRAIHEFFYLFKVPRRGGVTPIAFKGSYRKVEVVNQILSVSHSLWRNVITQKQPGISSDTVIETRHPDGVVQANPEKWQSIVAKAPPKTKPAPMPDYVNTYFYPRI